jgi:DNA-binding transcriptional ArsR family regulator
MDAMSDLLDTASGGPAGHWVTVAELARLRNVSRQTISEKVSRLEKEGRVKTRLEGRARYVDLAAYDRAVGFVGDASREIGAQTKKADATSSTLQPTGALRDAQADRAQYEARLKALDYAERTRQLVPIKGDQGIENALVKVSDKIVRDLETPMTWASELMDAAREGEPAMRRVLRAKIRALRLKVGEHLMELAGEGGEAELAGVQVDIDFEGDA